MDTLPRMAPTVAVEGPVRPDQTGQGWTHPDVRHLLRWLGRHNSLLQTIAAAPKPAARPARRRAVAV